ncbi:hypothetical protein LZP97_26455 (plasmid) [Rhodococcus sp. DMF-1]|uniref:hypothetical protein n=1 Tax=Rhodococcus sp. DMF-1 TaxID=2907624 RepID=UPI001F3B1752|nr:hypothetical protein [Rhodococcus sp. DMF-1]UIR39641.1 hypothetical protein LZP97_26455 [Rhodococcus sp. DMF-1]
MEIDGQETIAAWNKIAPRIDRYVERIGDRSDFSVASGTSLSGDDAASLPYHVSHAVRMCFTAGIDHLHALRQLVVTDRVLHVAAPFSLPEQRWRRSPLHSGFFIPELGMNVLRVRFAGI